MTTPTPAPAAVPARPDGRVPFDLAEIPFSTRGAWTDVSPVVGLHETADHLHLVSHRNGLTGVLQLSLWVRGREVEVPVVADSSVLTWSSPDGTVEAVHDGPEALRFRGGGLALRLTDAATELTPFTGTYLYEDLAAQAFCFTSYETGQRYRVTVLAGEVTAEGVEALGESPRWVEVASTGQEAWEIAVEEFPTTRTSFVPTRSFDDAVVGADQDFGAWLERVAPWRTAATPAADRAAYVLWSATVAPEGFLTRESVLMSMHWMDKVWSWDHCFNALALAPGDPRAALDQFLAPFDHQTPEGALPDSIAHSELLYNYVKPPIHGWALARLLPSLDLTADELQEVHDRLAAWTRFWLEHRVAPGRTAAHYQHGNDSGWDNATTFDLDRVVEGPDLAAFLVLQLGVVRDLALRLGRDDEAATWDAARQVQLDALEGLWDGRAYRATAPRTGRRSTSTSLLALMPLVLGDELDAGRREALGALVDEHLTEWGLATERPDSAAYEADGYWRGPIWAPSTVLLEDGLRRAGLVDRADRVSASFRRLCEASGFAENFDALTGEGLRDRAYTWTASAYLLLAAEAAEREAVA